jgi:hypothetical protein
MPFQTAGYNSAMKNKILNPNNTPYLLAGGSVFLGVALLVFNYLTAEPIARDPNIGADLRQLVGMLMIIVGSVSYFVVALIRLVKRMRK